MLAGVIALGLGACLDLELASPDWSEPNDPDGSIFDLLPPGDRDGGAGRSSRGEDGPAGSGGALPELPVDDPQVDSSPRMDAEVAPPREGDATVIPRVTVPDSSPPPAVAARDYKVCLCKGPSGFVDSVLIPDSWRPSDCETFCRGIDASESRLVCFTADLWSAGTGVPLPAIPPEPGPNSCNW